MNLFGKYFDDNEKVLKSLTKIYGIGRKTAQELGMTFGIGSHSKVNQLSKETWSRIIQAIELGPLNYNSLVKPVLINSPLAQAKLKKQTSVDQKVVQEQCQTQFSIDQRFEHKVNKSLKQGLCETRAITAIRENIELAKKIKSYRGLRHLEGLPCRGQRTHTNAITARKNPFS
jgi:small subunit ribosomal protein S13